MKKVYIIKCKHTGEAVEWVESLQSFVDSEMNISYREGDTVRRMLAKTRKTGEYYRGWKILYYGKEKPEVITEKAPIASYKEDPIMPIKQVKNVLIIGDLHFPFVLEHAFEFVKKVYDENDITDVIFIGDILDNHYTGYHETDPDGYSANDELRYAQLEIEKWGRQFPNAKMVIGNHDRLPNRKAFTAGISKRWIRTINEVLGIPWKVRDSYTIGNFFFTHGDGQQAKSKSVDLSMSVVQGHYHSKFSCTLVSANRKNLTYAIQVGCLIDHNSFAMAYGKGGKTMARGVVVIKDILGDTEIKMISMPRRLLED